ncbi:MULTISPECIES: winged helix-turn-helix domain-containing protein [Amycolatopsis]|uniref:winged helix-turn-helix domain-containing protein n=1 Tax=Amycolatopsis TaxID=1813 RepID=UPI0027DF1D65|nr:winged helix-turn-helix domain-containing protein [Amycolatopsis tucumanensis]
MRLAEDEQASGSRRVAEGSGERVSGDARVGTARVTVGAFEPGAGDAPYLYEAMADHLAARVAAGELADGARLPSEVRLAREYGVSLGTARHATEILRERGLARTVRAKGTFIVRRERAAGDGGEGYLVLEGMAGGGSPVPILVGRAEPVIQVGVSGPRVRLSSEAAAALREVISGAWAGEGS